MITLAISAFVSIVAYCLIYYVIMPKDIQERSLNFHIHREDTANGKHQSTTLISNVLIGSSLAGYFHLTGIGYDTQMDSEYYNIDVIFDLVENSHNLDNLNFYLTTNFSSYNPV